MNERSEAGKSGESTGFRAPFIGEQFGGAAREDYTFQDPCSDVPVARIGP